MLQNYIKNILKIKKITILFSLNIPAIVFHIRYIISEKHINILIKTYNII